MTTTLTQTTTPAGFTIHTAETAPGASRPIVQAIQKNFGGVLPNLFGVTADSPELLAANTALMEQSAKTSLTKLEQQVIDLALSQQNDCGYCLVAHTFLSRSLPQEPIQAARTGTPTADPRLEALRRFALELARTSGHVSAETQEQFYAAGYTRKQALEAILIAGAKIIQNQTNSLAETPIDDLFTAR